MLAPTSLIANRAFTTNGITFAAGDEVTDIQIATIGDINPLLARGWLRLSPDPYSRRTKAGTPQPGNLSASSRVQFLSASVTVPEPPTALVATPGETTTSIAFTAGYSGGSAITDYEYKVGAGAWTSAVTTSSPVTVTGLTKGTAYSVTLRAVNAEGNGWASEAVAFTTDSEPAAPTNLVATPGDTTASIAFTAPADNGAAITDYEYNVDSGGWLSGSVSASPVVVTGLTNGIEVSIEIRAVNSVGAGTASAAVLVTPSA